MNSFPFLSDGRTVANVLRDEFLTKDFIADLVKGSKPVTQRSLESLIVRRAEQLAEDAGIAATDVWGNAEHLAIEVFERYELQLADANEIIES